MKFRDLKKVDFQVLRQPMPTCDVVQSVHIMSVLLWQQTEIQQIDRDRTGQIFIVLPLTQALIHLRPVVQRPLFHILIVHQLNLDVDLAAVAHNTVNIEPRELCLAKPRIKFPISERDVREFILALAPEHGIEETECNALALLPAKDKFEQIVVHWVVVLPLHCRCPSLARRLSFSILSFFFDRYKGNSFTRTQKAQPHAAALFSFAKIRLTPPGG